MEKVWPLYTVAVIIVLCNFQGTAEPNLLKHHLPNF